jgi:hypothetical protein
MIKMFNWFDFFFALFLGVLVLLLIALLAALIFGAVYGCSATEVETYTVGCEVSQMAYAEEVMSRSSSRPVYKMGVRNDDFATTFNISAEEFAKYAVGDIVEVEVAVYEYMDGSLNNKYKLVN